MADMNKRANLNYDGDLPEFLGDRYYSQDLLRDNLFAHHVGSRIVEDLIAKTPILLRGGFVQQSTKSTIYIAKAIGYVPKTVEVPDSFEAIPQTKMSVTTKQRVESENVTLELPGAVLDGTTVNYVKLRYKEIDGAIRNKAKTLSDYVYEKIESYEILVDPIVPTQDEILLATLVGVVNQIFKIFNYPALNLDSVGNGNILINSCFQNWQRGTSGFLPMLADRWFVNKDPITLPPTQQSLSGPTDGTIGEDYSEYFYRIYVIGGSSPSKFTAVSQKIENLKKYAGKTLTLSFWANCDVSRTIGIEFEQNFGTGGSPSSPVTGIGAIPVTILSGWCEYRVTVTIPDTKSKIYGTNKDDYLRLNIFLTAGSDWVSRTGTISQANGVISLAKIMLNEGFSAQPYSPYGGSLEEDTLACARYYRIERDFSGVSFGSTTSSFHFRGIPMRITPKITYLVGTTVYYPNGTTATAPSSPEDCPVTEYYMGSGIANVVMAAAGVVGPLYLRGKFTLDAEFPTP